METKKLGSVAPAATTNTTLYTVPAAKSAVCVLSVCNTNTFAVTIRVAISATTTPTIGEYIEYDVVIAPHGILERSSIAIGENEKMVIFASNTNVAFRLYGMEK